MWGNRIKSKSKRLCICIIISIISLMLFGCSAGNTSTEEKSDIASNENITDNKEEATSVSNKINTSVTKTNSSIINVATYKGIAESNFINELTKLGYKNINKRNSYYSEDVKKGSIISFIPTGDVKYDGIINYDISLGAFNTSEASYMFNGRTLTNANNYLKVQLKTTLKDYSISDNISVEEENTNDYPENTLFNCEYTGGGISCLLAKQECDHSNWMPTYKYIGDANHEIYCSKCKAFMEYGDCKEEIIKYGTNSHKYHTIKCALCGNTYEEPCDIVSYSSDDYDEKYHYSYCSRCKVKFSYEHIIEKTDDGMCTCTECKYEYPCPHPKTKTEVDGCCTYKICTECGYLVQTIENHKFNSDGICIECGAIR